MVKIVGAITDMMCRGRNIVEVRMDSEIIDTVSG